MKSYKVVRAGQYVHLVDIETGVKVITVSRNNRKLKDVIIFNIPAGKEYGCRENCAGCYAMKAQRIYPEVLPCRERNWNASKEAEFVDNMVMILNSLPEKYVRFHESGDIYSEEYFIKLCEIAKRVDKKFYIYTKRNEFVNEAFKPVNLNVIYSVLPCGNYNYGSNDVLFALKESYPYAHICECGFGGKFESKCGKDCTLCMEGKVNVVLFKIH